jgi:hypothetical protein
MRYTKHFMNEWLNDLDDRAGERAGRIVTSLAKIDEQSRDVATERAIAELASFGDSPRAWLYISQLELHRGNTSAAVVALLRSYELRDQEGPRANMARRLRERLIVEQGGKGP